ncbi:hypothetical protein HYV10_03015 [Candidatus Dependentiae bacterium]|nr:hypothetical protein [Candidatus Dependentiae bacterium]
MNDKEKMKTESTNPFLEKFKIDSYSENKEEFKDYAVKKGFPLEITLFWTFIGLLLLYKMMEVIFLELPMHAPIRNQLRELRFVQEHKKFGKALKGHEQLMEIYPSYKKIYFFEIAQCYLACGDVNHNFRKGLELLIDRQLSERQFVDLTNVIPGSLLKLFLSLFLVYEKTNKKEKIYIFDHENLGLR